MALIKCYECGKEISDKAPSCPHCGAPQLVSKNKEVKTKKSLVFSKYLKPIGIGLGVIVLPLAAVASVPLFQANGNVDAVVWRFKNKKFIKNRCNYNNIDIEKKSHLYKKCQSILFKLGKKAENVAFRSHKKCIGERNTKTLKNYNYCIGMWDRIYEGRAAEAAALKKSRLNRRTLDQFTYKDKTYTASRVCPVGQNMYWSITTGFMRKTKVSELGCMTKSQNEAFWRDYNLRQAGAPRGGGGGSGYNYQSEANRMRIQTNEYKQLLKDYSRDMGWE